MDALGDLVTARGFALGLLWGCIAVVISPLVARFTRRSLIDMGGFAFAFAAYMGVRAWGGTGIAPLSIALALALLGAGGAVIDHVELRLPARLPRAAIAPAIALLPGSLALAVAVPHHPRWVPLMVLVATPIVGGLLHDFDRVHSARAAPFLLLLIAVVGAYLTVPDTEMMLVLAGVSVPLALLSYPQPLAAFGPAGSALVAGVYCWMVTVSGRERPGAVVGSLGALGLLLAEPVGRRFKRALTTKVTLRGRRRRRRSRDRSARYTERWMVVVTSAAVCQIVLMLYATRVAGLEQTAWMAALSMAPALIVAVFAVAEIVPSDETRAAVAAYTRRSRSHRWAAWGTR